MTPERKRELLEMLKAYARGEYGTRDPDRVTGLLMGPCSWL